MTLQRLLDALAVSDLGLPSVTELQYATVPSLFFKVFPAQGDRLDLPSAKIEASAWHLRNAFRDALEATGLYLDGCRTVSAVCRQAKTSSLTLGTFSQITGPEATAFHSLGVPAKLEKLDKDFGIQNDLTLHVLSINRVRNCLVHRLGTVTERDVESDGHLKLMIRVMELFAPDPNGGPDIVVERSGVVLPENAPLMLRARDTTRLFNLGDRIVVSYSEVLHSFLTIMQFAMLMTGTLQEMTASAAARQKPAEA